MSESLVSSSRKGEKGRIMVGTKGCGPLSLQRVKPEGEGLEAMRGDTTTMTASLFFLHFGDQKQ